MYRYDFRSSTLALAIMVPLFGLTACDTPQETGPKIVSATPNSIVIENVRTEDEIKSAMATAGAHCKKYGSSPILVLGYDPATTLRVDCQ